MRRLHRSGGHQAAVASGGFVTVRREAMVVRGEVTAVVGRVENGRLLLDLRAVAPEDDEQLAAAVIAAAGRPDSA